MDVVIHTAHKWVALVVVDRQDYINKARDLLADRETYRPLKSYHISYAQDY